MDDIFEFILALIFIVVSIYSELKKRKNQPDDQSEDDISVIIDDFFKNREIQNQKSNADVHPSSKEGDISIPPFQASEESTLSTRSLPTNKSEEMIFFPEKDFDLIKDWSTPDSFHQPEILTKRDSQTQPSFNLSNADKDNIMKSPTTKKQKDDNIDWQTDYDLEESLDGKVNLEALGGEGISLIDSHARPETATQAKQLPKTRWSRQEFCRAMILSLILEPYDIKRAIDRWPGNRIR